MPQKSCVTKAAPSLKKKWPDLILPNASQLLLRRKRSKLLSSLSHKARKYRTPVRSEAKLRALYDAAVMGKRRGITWLEPADLFAATGDPLAEQNYPLAAHIYGVTLATRPVVTLRRIQAETFGDALTSLTDLAIWFQDHKGWSAIRSSREAAVLAGERGTWIGVKAPVSFERAVDLVRKSVGKARALGRPRYQPVGRTGQQMFVVPAPDRLVAMPAPLPPRTYLSSDGTWVQDDAYWRRRLRDQDVLLKARSGESHPTIPSVVTAG